MPRPARSTPDRPSAAVQLARELAPIAPASSLVPELARWLGDARFRAFVEGNRSKVRRKLREPRTADVLDDLRLELRLARLLVADRRFEVVFEAHGRTGPDFTVRYRAGSPIDVELTRRRPPAAAEANPYEAPILAKLRQLQPGVASVLIVATGAEVGGRDALEAAARGIVARAEQRDDGWFARRAIESTRTFWAGFHRLGAVIAWREEADRNGRAGSWVNPAARIAVPTPAIAALERCLRDADA
jgi:hypothetical protein